jgi:hypothetical protein
MSLDAPPIRTTINDEDGNLELPWLKFFNQTFNGDAGDTWTPTFVSLGSTGTPTITGRYYRISRYLLYFNILVTPSTNTTSTAGTTYVDNLPITPFNNGVCMSVSNDLGGALGMVNSSNNRIYTPAWTNVTTPVNIIGIVEAR